MYVCYLHKVLLVHLDQVLLDFHWVQHFRLVLVAQQLLEAQGVQLDRAFLDLL